MTGKTFDGFAPVGPYLVTKDEIDNPNNLRLTAAVNGKVNQDSNTSDMIFNCEELIAYISAHMTLEAGDIIMTGTPEGVIRSEEHTSELQSRFDLVCRLLLE